MARTYLILLISAHILRAYSENFRVVYEWYKLDFSWPDDKTKSDYYLQGQYIPENSIIRNIRIWRDRAFLTLPRSRTGVPVTMATVSAVPRGGSASPRLDPYPSWDYQKIGQCEYLQNVQSAEIDPNGFIWIVDAGSVQDVTTDQKCNPKILIFDIEKRELIVKKEFLDLNPNAVLGDIVLDPRKPKTAYISVNTDNESFILVYKTRTSYKITGLPTSDSKQITVNGTTVYLRNKLSLALSLTQNQLYFSIASSSNLYRVSLFHLGRGTKDISDNIQNLGNKTGLSTGMTIDSKQNLYFGLIESDSIVKLRLGSGLTAVEVFQDSSLLQWPDSFSFDESGRIWAVTNRFQTYLDGSVNVGVPNIRLVQAYTGSRSYLYGNYTDLPASCGSRNVFSVMILLCSSVYIVFK